MIDFCKQAHLHKVMKADLRISIKDYRRKKSLKVLLFRPPFPSRGFLVQMGAKPWSAPGRTASLTRILTALRKALVKASSAPDPSTTEAVKS